MKGNKMSNILMQASHQWAKRPDDERFCSLLELAKFTSEQRQNSKQQVLSSRKVMAAPIENDSKGLVVVGPSGNAVTPTNWSFGQLSRLASATPAYMRTLPPALAADCINWGLQNRDVEEVGVLLRSNGSDELATLGAMTGPNYGRIWNADIANAMVKRFGDGLNGDFKVPGEFGKDVPVTKANTTIYASDRDMFVFLADEKHRIEVPNRRNGESGSMARGFFVQNSEVGDGVMSIATFLFDYCCSNRIVWGAMGFKEIRMRHTSGAPDRWIEQAAPAIERYANNSTLSIVDCIAQAKAKKIGDDQDDVNEFLAKRFSKSQVKAINFAHELDEQRPIETLWDATTAVTAYARSINWQNERVAVEREGGNILSLAL
jgi:hypothetical protein